MYVRNLLTAGDYVTLVPIGLPLTLQYDENGMLEKVYHGNNTEGRNLSDKLLGCMRRNETAPVRIPITKGTTWVQGVLYTNTTYSTAGDLPMCIAEDIIRDYPLHPEAFNFFAGHVESLATVFQGATPIRRWLKIANFHLLPGFIASANLDRGEFLRICQAIEFPFKFPLVTDYIVYRKSEVLYFNTGMKQFTVDQVSRCLDTNGYVKAEITARVADSNGSPYTFKIPYGNAAEYNLETGSLVVQDIYDNIVWMQNDSPKSKRYKGDLVCPVCGNSYPIVLHGDTCCTDEHCMSRMYPRVEKLLNMLQLPALGVDEYFAAVKRKELTCIPDVLVWGVYANMHVKTTYSKLLQGIVPVECVPNGDLLVSLCHACNNSRATLEYYLKHPDKMMTNLDLPEAAAAKFGKWIHDPYNLSDVMTLLDHPNFEFELQNKKYDGAPIFRGKKIMLTGRFQHGDLAEVEAILSSYAASVTTKLEDDVDCILLGAIPEDIDGHAIRGARRKHISVIREKEFFDMYEIDDDLQHVL